MTSSSFASSYKISLKIPKTLNKIPMINFFQDVWGYKLHLAQVSNPFGSLHPGNFAIKKLNLATGYYDQGGSFPRHLDLNDLRERAQANGFSELFELSYNLPNSFLAYLPGSGRNSFRLLVQETSGLGQIQQSPHIPVETPSTLRDHVMDYGGKVTHGFESTFKLLEKGYQQVAPSAQNIRDRIKLRFRRSHSTFAQPNQTPVQEDNADAPKLAEFMGPGPAGIGVQSSPYYDDRSSRRFDSCRYSNTRPARPEDIAGSSTGCEYSASPEDHPVHPGLRRVISGDLADLDDLDDDLISRVVQPLAPRTSAAERAEDVGTSGSAEGITLENPFGNNNLDLSELSVHPIRIKSGEKNSDSHDGQPSQISSRQSTADATLASGRPGETVSSELFMGPKEKIQYRELPKKESEELLEKEYQKNLQAAFKASLHESRATSVVPKSEPAQVRPPYLFPRPSSAILTDPEGFHHHTPKHMEMLKKDPYVDLDTLKEQEIATLILMIDYQEMGTDQKTWEARKSDLLAKLNELR
jgi:hypothetical protein